MAGYVKIFTDVFDDEWFIGLSNYDRGIWLQLCIYAKKKGDTGIIIERKLSIIAALLSCDVRIFRKSLAKMQSNEKVHLTETPQRAMVEVLNYEYYQRVKKVEPRKSAARVQQECSKNAPIRREDKRREDHIRETPELAPQELAELFNSICTKYPQVTSLKTDSERYKKCKLRLATHSNRKFWELIFNKTQRSELMQKWASFSWLVKSENNLLKTYEGEYDNNRGMTLKEEQDHYKDKARSGREPLPAAISKIVNKVFEKEAE